MTQRHLARPNAFSRQLRRVRQWLPEPVRVPLRWLRAHLTLAGRSLRQLDDRLLQPSSFTTWDRHPELFAIARERLGALEAPRILSFGCSTGEEAFTLAEYLPNAQIDAIDINPRSIAIAKRALPVAQADRIRFECSACPPEAEAIYDAIFCLSVLRHGRLEHEQPDNCSDVLPFARFAETIADLDRALKPGGLLFLWGCNFRFGDTPQAAQYRTVATPGKKPQPGPYYGPDNRQLDIDELGEYLFEKIERDTI